EFPFDAFVSKTITLAPRQGNPPPRLWETPAGMINSIGLPNKGLAGFLAEDLRGLAELPVPLCVSVMGFSRDELAELVTEVAARAPAGPGSGPAGGVFRAPRSARSPSRRSAPCADASAFPRLAWEASRAAATRAISSSRALVASRWARRASVTPPRAAGSPLN